MQDISFLPCKGDQLYIDEKYIAAVFGGKRKVLSTSPQNGGISENLKAVFNFDGKQNGGQDIVLEGGTYESHMRYVSDKILGLPADKTSGIMTAVFMKNAAYVRKQCRDIIVSVIATAGIEVNGARAGDRAWWYEENGNWIDLDEKSRPTLGTINILVFLNADLTDGAIAKALITCTEAKTAAIQELCICSRYSNGIATGSGTDSVIIAADMESDFKITETGGYSKAGELIGCAVKEAVKESLFLHTGVDSKKQHNVFRRLERFGVTADALICHALKTAVITQKESADFKKRAEVWACSEKAAEWAALEAHLLDEKEWGLLTKKEVSDAEKRILAAFDMLTPDYETSQNLFDSIIYAISS